MTPNGERAEAHVRHLHLRPIHLAVLKDDPAAFQALLASRADLDVKDAKGATPLMLAALFGNVRMAKALLIHGASVIETDKKGRSARDYAKTKPAPLCRTHRLYRQAGARRPFVKSKNRSRMRKIFGHWGAMQSQAHSQDHPLSAAKFEIQGKKIAIVIPVGGLQTDRNIGNSTVGFIAGAGRAHPAMLATSKWDTDDNPGGTRRTASSHILNNTEWTQNVREFSELVGFRLWHSRRDARGERRDENTGRWAAGHVEKKLSLYWLRRQLRITFGTEDYSNIGKLKEMIDKLPLGRRRAYLFLNHYPCKNCWDFSDLIRELSGLEIILQPRPFLIPGKRPVFSVQPPAPDQQASSGDSANRSAQKGLGTRVGGQASAMRQSHDAAAGNAGGIDVDVISDPDAGFVGAAARLNATSPSLGPCSKQRFSGSNGHAPSTLARPTNSAFGNPSKDAIASANARHQLHRQSPCIVTDSPTFTNMDIESTPARHSFPAFEPTPRKTGRRATPPWKGGKPTATPVTVDPFQDVSSNSAITPGTPIGPGSITAIGGASRNGTSSAVNSGEP